MLITFLSTSTPIKSMLNFLLLILFKEFKRAFDDYITTYKILASKKELENIKMPIITTEKDAVKIKDFDLDNIYALKLRLNLNCRELLDD